MSDRPKSITFRFSGENKEWAFVPQCPICAKELGDQELADHLRESLDCIPGVVHEE